MKSQLRKPQRRSARSIEECEQRLLMAVDLTSFQPQSGNYRTDFQDAIQWAHDEASLTGRGQTVAVIDSGIPKPETLKRVGVTNGNKITKMLKAMDTDGITGKDGNKRIVLMNRQSELVKSLVK